MQLIYRYISNKSRAICLWNIYFLQLHRYILDSISCMHLLLIIKIHKTINKQPLYIHLRNKCGITKNKPRMSIHMYIWRCDRKYFVTSKFQLFKTGINTTPETEYFNRPFSFSFDCKVQDIIKLRSLIEANIRKYAYGENDIL